MVFHHPQDFLLLFYRKVQLILNVLNYFLVLHGCLAHTLSSLSQLISAQTQLRNVVTVTFEVLLERLLGKFYYILN